MTFDRALDNECDSLQRPYRRDLWPIWRTGTPLLACDSASALYEKYLEYKDNDDFIGMDTARQFILMGYARSRRLSQKSGKSDLCARIFFGVLLWVMKDVDFKRMRAEHCAPAQDTTKVVPTDKWVQFARK